MKLHLGCGQRYLEDYVNIDYPMSEHSVQSVAVADMHADITELSFPAKSVDEIRLHHVFEHFPRPVACALLSAWHIWLAVGGRLHIEVPDFARTAIAIINPFRSLHAKLVAERHLYGSHEARWASHCEGYSKSTLTALMESFAFRVKSVRRNAWRGTYNIEIIAQKARDDLTKNELELIAERYFSDHLLDSSETEQRLLDTWISQYKSRLAILIAKCD